ncbi:protein FAM166B-like isoform X1 [Dendronephthya gigantea]|uniref:protein FAM166B-like isoform X1 n=1 Tax=Dendronephthya gigantea TaxID=151771 RepID=UPI001069C5E3|nr:protein FAM166B-like isoform X1 [Dendronephthya gigantea]
MKHGLYHAVDRIVDNENLPEFLFRYIGYCPQFKYQIGETFGRTTSQLLTDSRIASSGQPVLSPLDPNPPAPDQRRQLISRRAFKLGDQKLFEKMVPGYTGFIPKSEHHFGKRYAETSLSSVASFEADQEFNRRRLRDLQTVQALQTGEEVPGELINEKTIKLTNHETPLKKIRTHPAVYYSRMSPQHSLSPLTMGNENPKKYFMSGYTGFVPRARGLIGSGYPTISNKGLCDFTDECERLKNVKSKPVKVHRHIVKKNESKPLYLKDTGMVPHYTGHVPGEKFRYGQTFGFSTKNARQPIETF